MSHVKHTKYPVIVCHVSLRWTTFGPLVYHTINNPANILFRTAYIGPIW